ncbi:hypothetical protein, partial [Stenotrophomonas sp.]|uniref:hypothetical protein n=1 Tax=Stenotrophomonas sp. TaxID=69392 RepID=UPI00289B4A0A
AAKFSRFTKRIATIRSQGLSGRGAARAGFNMAQELSPASARRAAVQRMTAGRFRNSLANGATSVPSAAPRSSVLSDDFLTRLRESEGLSLVRQRRASPEVPDFQPPPLDRTKSPPWTTRDWGVSVESASPSSNINVNSHIDYMIQSVPETAERAQAVRRAAAVQPPSYDQATLPSYESTLPPSYDSHGFP